MLLLLLPILTLIRSPQCIVAQRSDPTQFNGGSVLAMTGRNSVAVAIDARFGLGIQTISTGDDHYAIADNGLPEGGSPRLMHLPNSNALLAWTGLYGDGMGFAEEVNVLLARKVRRAGRTGFQYNGVGATVKRKVSPRSIANFISYLLYKRRNAPYYVEPVVVGLETVRVPISTENHDGPLLERNRGSTLGLRTLIQSSTSKTQQILSSEKLLTRAKRTKYKMVQKPYLCGTDMLGAQSTSHSFVCSGIASRSLHGTSEALWRPNLEGDELVEVCGRAFVSALERDCYSGYGAVVYLIQGCEDGNEDNVEIIEYILSCRND